MVSIPRIPRSYKPSSAVPMISVPKGNKDQKVVQNVRARSILQPRAVLSSPDNDMIIGKRNRIEKEQPPPPKNQNMVQSRHALCKIVPSLSPSPSPTRSCTPRKVVARSPRNTRRKTKEEAGNSNKDPPVKTRKSSKEETGNSNKNPPVKTRTSSKEGSDDRKSKEKASRGTGRSSSV